MAAPRVSRRLRLDDEEDGPAPGSAGGETADSARAASGGAQPAVLGPMAGNTSQRGRSRLDPQPRGRGGLAPIRGSRSGQQGRQPPTVDRESDSGRDDSDSAGQPEAKPGARRQPIPRSGSRAQDSQDARPRVQTSTASGEPRGSGVTLPPRRPIEPAAEASTVRSSDSKFLSTLDSHRPHALPDEKYAADAKVRSACLCATAPP